MTGMYTRRFLSVKSPPIVVAETDKVPILVQKQILNHYTIIPGLKPLQFLVPPAGQQTILGRICAA